MCSISVEVAEGAMSLAQDGCRLEDEDRRSGGVEDWVSVETVFWQERASARVRPYQERKWRRVTILEVLRKVCLGMKLVNAAGEQE